MLLKGEELRIFILENNILHFTVEEFTCKHCGKVVIDLQLVELVEELRRYLGKPVVITSAYRCPVHNRRIGGVKNSAHVRGYALDVKCTNSKDRQRILEFLIVRNVRRIGVHPRFIHFDVDPDKPSPRLWLYGRRRHVA